MHRLVMQSELARQLRPTPPLPHIGPPPSTSVSLPLWMLSLQAGGGLQRLPKQLPDAQSELTKHCRPMPHIGHAPPPQSTSLSLPSRIPFTQLTSRSGRTT